MVLNLGTFSGSAPSVTSPANYSAPMPSSEGHRARRNESLRPWRRQSTTTSRTLSAACRRCFARYCPITPAARERWLTRNEAARLIRAAWRKRSVYDGAEKGRCYTSRHIARFILVGLYTGSRAGAICGASLIPTIGRGYVNLETGQFRRLAYGKKESNKRQPTIDLPPPLLAHIRRWQRLGISTKAVVEYRGAPVIRVTTGWRAVVKLAGLETDIPQQKVIPHTLRHTAISWYLRAGIPPHQVSDYCGVSEQIIRKVYKHHIRGGFDNVLAASHRLGRTS